MLAALHKYLPGVVLLLTGLTGLALASLGMSTASLFLAPKQSAGPAAARAALPAPVKTSLLDNEVILKRDIFDSTGQGRETLLGIPAEQGSGAPTAVRSRQDLALVGTVVDGQHSLALLRVGKEPRILHLDEELPGGGTLVAVRRNEADIRFADSSTQTLKIPREGVAGAAAGGPAGNSSAAAPSGGGSQVKALGDNRYVIARAEVEKARANIGELLKQARMEPNIVNGQTNGFVVKMIQPRSLLGQLGLQVGDVVTQVNGVELNSPEKALQVFQQLREARRLSVDLLRGNQPLSLQYEVH
jgi:general secretion pathway protein C